MAKGATSPWAATETLPTGGGRPTSKAAQGRYACSCVLAAPHCHDLDFVNSLPTVTSQLDRLGLCPPASLACLRDYCANREGWYDAIANHHSIPAFPAVTTTAHCEKSPPRKQSSVPLALTPDGALEKLHFMPFRCLMSWR